MAELTYISDDIKTMRAAIDAGYVWADDAQVILSSEHDGYRLGSTEYPRRHHELSLYHREQGHMKSLNVCAEQYLIDSPALFGKTVQKLRYFYSPSQIADALAAAKEWIERRKAETTANWS